MNKIRLQDAVEWRIGDWLPAFQYTFSQLPDKISKGSKVLELGHGTGKMSCYLAQHFDLQVDAYEINPDFFHLAINTQHLVHEGVDRPEFFDHCLARRNKIARINAH